MRQERQFSIRVVQVISMIKYMRCHAAGPQNAVALRNESLHLLRSIVLQHAPGMAQIEAVRADRQGAAALARKCRSLEDGNCLLGGTHPSQWFYGFHPS